MFRTATRIACRINGSKFASKIHHPAAVVISPKQVTQTTRVRGWKNCGVSYLVHARRSDSRPEAIRQTTDVRGVFLSDDDWALILEHFPELFYKSQTK
jgi:hypothetical protein